MNRQQLISVQIERARCVIRRQHKSIATEQAYCGWLIRYFNFVFRLPRELASEQKAEAFLTHLARVNDVSASTQNSAFHAIRFFYQDVLGKPLQRVDALRASRPQQIRRSPAIAETRALLADVKDVSGYPTNLIIQMLYGCGLRVSEPLELRVKDIQFEDSRLFIMGGKGRKDRVVNLPCSLVNDLQDQLVFAKTIWRRDCLAKIPVQLPHQLAAKYPEFQFDWSWAWVFPLRWPSRHPRTGKTVRYHVLPAAVQQAVKESRRRLRISIVPHSLRHAYATDCLNLGVNIKALSAAMGHAQIETTAGYCHAEALSVPSPLEVL